MADEVYVFDRPADIFEVKGMKEKRDQTGNVIDGNVYLFCNASSYNKLNFEQRKREYWEVCKDPDVKATFASSDGPGTPQIIKENDEEYVLMERPLAARKAQLEYNNRIQSQIKKDIHTKHIPGVGTMEWIKVRDGKDIEGSGSEYDKEVKRIKRGR